MFILKPDQGYLLVAPAFKPEINNSHPFCVGVQNKNIVKSLIPAQLSCIINNI